MKAYLTSAGSAVVTQLLASQGTLNITRAEIGSGVVTSEEAARERTSLVSKLADANLVSCTLSNQQAVIDIQYNNSAQTEAYTVSEIGIYCTNPSDSSQEVLYCYVTFGDTPDTIVAGSTAMYTRTYRVYVFVSDLQNISVSVSPAGTVSPTELTTALNALEETINESLEGKADKALTGTATGTPGVDPINPVFVGSDGNMGTLTPVNARIALGVPNISTISVPLPASGWTAEEPYTQTVSVAGVTATSNLIVAGDSTDAEAYTAWNESAVYCSAQAAGSMTFTASDVPAVDVTANVMIVEVRS